MDCNMFVTSCIVAKLVERFFRKREGEGGPARPVLNGPPTVTI